MSLGFLWELHWICRLLLVVQFLLCWFCWSMSIGDLFTFCSLPQPFSSVICRSPCRGHLHTLLSLLLDFFFEAIVNGIVFLCSVSICSLLVYRKATDFYELILYPATLLELFMVLRCFLCHWGTGSCHLQIGILWLFLYLSVFFLFLLLACSSPF
jgi:hypothetical protein